MIKRISYNKTGSAIGYSEFVCDGEDDIKKLPTSIDKKEYGAICSVGSTAIVISNSDIYILGGDNEWHKL